MKKLIEIMLKENILKKDSISYLVRHRPNRLDINFANLIEHKFLEVKIVEDFLAKKIREGVITLAHLEKIEGMNISRILKLVSQELKVEFIDIDEIELDMRLFAKTPYKQLLKYSVLPSEETELSITIIFADPLNMEAQDVMQRIFPRKPINIAIARPKQITEYLQRFEINESVKGLIGNIRDDLKDTSTEGREEDESPAVLKLIHIILRQAITSRASDIHIEATEKSCIIRCRIDGMLVQVFTFDKDIFSPLSSRMKLVSSLDIAEKRKPQDGRFSMVVAGNPYDFRVSTLPTLWGESIVMRILDKSKVMIRLEDAGMNASNLRKFTDSIDVPYGIVLVTGPTGSGKTTTLYGALNAIRDVRDKIITVEDPVEYQMNGIQQVHVNAAAGLSFSDALRSILRQDPDKIMIGEIRDQETLRIAIQAALTGHLVLSTLHTNDAISAVTRILDMGIERYLVSGALVAIQAQRLVRKLCSKCIVKDTLSQKILEEIGDYLPENPQFYKGEGCKDCGQSGYSGREMISEVLQVSEVFARLIASGGSKEQMTELAYKEGFEPMFADGIAKALQGKSTVEEVFRVARL